MSKKIRISEVINLLQNGYTRWEKQALEPGRSIEKHYDLNFSECQTLFAHEKIKGVKTRNILIEIIDDTTEEQTLRSESEPTPVEPEHTPVQSEPGSPVQSEPVSPQSYPGAITPQIFG